MRITRKALLVPLCGFLLSAALLTAFPPPGLGRPALPASAHADAMETPGNAPADSVGISPPVQLIEFLPKEALVGRVELGAHETPTAPAGGALTLALPIRYTVQGRVYDTNAGEDGALIAYEEGTARRGRTAFAQALAGELSELTVTVAPEQAEDFPLLETALSESRPLLAEGENNGYAVFDDLPLRPDAQPGVYTVNLEVSWRDQEGETRSELVAADIELTPFSVPYGGGVIVFTFAELKDAIENQTYNPIYLGYSLATDPPEPGVTVNDGVISFPGALSSGIKVRRNITIIGTDPREKEPGAPRRVTLIDTASEVITDTILASDENLTLTLRNVDVEGRNFYGILCGGSQPGTRLVFEDVTYTGRQISYARGTNSWVSFADCDVTIASVGASLGQEVTEAPEVRLYGANTFRKTSTAVLSMFWLTGSSNRITVAEGAQVTISTPHYLVFTDGATTLDVNGSLWVETGYSNGCMTYGTQDFVSVTIPGSLTVRHLDGSTNPSLRTQALTVTGSLDIERNASSGACVGITKSGGIATFTNPRRVSLSNPSGVLLRATTPTATFRMTAQAMNLWPASGEKRIWNNNDLSSFTINGTSSSSTTTGIAVINLSDMAGAALGVPKVGVSTFNLSGAKRLLIGQYAATIDPGTALEGSAQVAGTAPEGATQTVREYVYAGGVLGSLLQTDDGIPSDGTYRTGDGFLPLSSQDHRVYVSSILDDLEVQIYADVKVPLYLYDVPETLPFETTAVSGRARWVPRQETGWTLQVLDNRNSGSWKLTAAATPLTSADSGDALPNALVFVDENDDARPLSGGAAVLVAEKPANAERGVTSVNWESEKGLLVRLAPYEGKAEETYTATITWTLEDTP